MGNKRGDGDWSCPSGYSLPTTSQWSVVSPCIPAGTTPTWLYLGVGYYVGGCNCNWNNNWCYIQSISTMWGTTLGRACGDYAQMHVCVGSATPNPTPGSTEGSCGPSWGPLGPHWRPLGPSWGALGPSWGPLGGLLGCLGAILEASWVVLERREAEKGSYIMSATSAVSLPLSPLLSHISFARRLSRGTESFIVDTLGNAMGNERDAGHRPQIECK